MAQLPRIACFHGSGSNKEVFEVQCAQLSHLLKDIFEFVFFNAPFAREAGPGVLPAFEDYEPFYTWFKINDDGTTVNDGSGYDETGRDGIERLLELMEKKGGQWVGVLGFSSGTRVASGLLLDQQRRVQNRGSNTNSIGLRFGVLCMGGKEPMGVFPSFCVSIWEDLADVPPAKTPEDGSKLDLIRIPTLHVHGLRDQFLQYGKEQYDTYFESSTAELYEVDYHHAMPWKPAEVEELAARIKALYQRS